jgi:large subunit ribosomal protein L14
MIQHKTILKIVDNSGAKTAQCIRVLGGYKKKYGYIGDYVLISIKGIKLKLVNKVKIQYKAVFKALVVQTKLINFNNTGLIFKFSKNAVILIDKQNNPLATRVKVSVIESLRSKFYKLASISVNFI